VDAVAVDALDGLRIVYDRAGDGPAVVLLHGFRSNVRTHWRAPGWVRLLAHSHTVIAIDQRGHGRSGKPRDPRAYARPAVAADVITVLDHATVEKAVLFGYSMGACVAVEALLRAPARFSGAILGGMGTAWPSAAPRDCRDEEPPGSSSRVRDRQHLGTGAFWFLRYYNPAALRAFRRGFFDGQPPMPADRLSAITSPVLVVAGTRDRYCPGTRDLALRLPSAVRLALPGQGHISAVSDRRFQAAVLRWLATVT
jgi:pimeloyl-ACP methyl ester carboxylesterase